MTQTVINRCTSLLDIGTVLICRPNIDLDLLKFDIQPISLNGKSVAHLHTNKNLYEVLGSMGGLLYAYDDCVKVSEVDGRDGYVLLEKNDNPTDLQQFILPIRQVIHDFTIL